MTSRTPPTAAVDEHRHQSARRKHHLTGRSGVRALAVCLAAIGTTLTLSPVRDLDAHRGSITVALLLAVAFALAEAYPVHLHRGRDTHSFSLSEIPLVIGLLAVGPIPLIAARVVGAGATLAAVRRQRGVKLGFNVAHLLTEVSLAVLVFHAIAERSILVADERVWIAALAAGAVTHLYGWVAISAVISVNEAALQSAEIRSTLTAGLGAVVVNTSLALLGAVAYQTNANAVALLAVLAAVAAGSYHTYSTLRHGYGRLEMLYQFTGAMGHTVAHEDTVTVVLTEARTALRSAHSGVVWFDQHSGVTTMRWLADELQEPRVIPADEIDASWWSEAAQGGKILVPRRRASVASGNESRAVTDGIAVPLRSDDRIDGVLIVAERLDDVTTFSREDVKLLSAIANHAQVALTNGRLLETEHQALHDALTGLPNRRMLAPAIREAIAGADTDPVALLLIDLDGFKEVNDALGHAAGDTLLVEVSRRLAAAVPEQAMLARLGGDEFCVVLPQIEDVDHARVHAERLLAAIRQPQDISGITVDVSASIGIALTPDHDDGTRLLEKADTAMYAAKARRSAIEVYSATSDHPTVRGLELTSALRAAIEDGDIHVHFQPKIDLISGHTIGAEALARWTHPDHGVVPADEFILLAERTGMIRPLTSIVLETAATQCSTWRRTRSDFTVAVNVSERNLTDINFPAEIDRILRRSGLDPSGLVLEVSERVELRDLGRTIDIIDRIRRLGVTVSLDDFGTGQSSFSHLKMLPVDEVKIDRSFVTTLAASRLDGSIVAAAITLAHDLGMLVVAEGVEDEATWTELVRLGCDQAQGYLFARPMPAGDFDAWANHNADTDRQQSSPRIRVR